MSTDHAVICDTSTLAAMVFGEPRAAEADALIRARRLLAPSLLRYELAQLAVQKCAARPDDASLVQRNFAVGLRLPVTLREPSLPAAVRAAHAEGLSAFEASYLQLAIELHVPLATLNDRLRQAAEELGLDAKPRKG